MQINRKKKEEKPSKNIKCCEKFLFFLKIKFLSNLKKKFIYGIFEEKIYFRIKFIILIIQTYFFFNALLFSDKYISARYSSKKGIGFAYIIIDGFSRISLAMFISFLTLKIIKWVLNTINNLENEYKLLTIKIIVRFIVNIIPIITYIYNYFFCILFNFLYYYYFD